MTCPQCEKLREAIEHLAHRWNESESVPSWVPLTLMNIVRYMAAPSPLTSTLTWIPVSERLPEESMRVLLVTKVGQLQVAFYDHDKQDFLIYKAKHITHWAELPPPPREQEPRP